MGSLVFQNILGSQVQGLKVGAESSGSIERTLRTEPWILDGEKLNLPAYRIFGDPLTRHHPHGRRVRHMPGLLDIPICAVFDYDPPIIISKKPTTETVSEGKDGEPEEKVSDTVRQKGGHSSSSLRRLRDALLSNSSGIQTKLDEIKRRSELEFHLEDIERTPTWREKLRAFVASLGLLSLHREEGNNRKETPRDRPRTLSSIQVLGTVGRTPIRPVTTGSGTLKLPPLKGAYPRLLQGYNGQPWFNSRPGLTSIRTPRIDDVAQQRIGRAPTAGGQTGSTARGHGHYSETTGRLVPPPSRAIRRGFTHQGGTPSRKRDEVRQPGKGEEEEIEGLVLGILCQLLEVDDLNSVHAWLLTATNSEKAIVLDLMRAALTGRSASDEGTRKDHMISGLREPTNRQQRDSVEASGSGGTMATGDVVWTDKTEGTNNSRRKGRVDRLVFDHSQPRIRTNQITCLSTKERSSKRSNEGQQFTEDNNTTSAA